MWGFAQNDLTSHQVGWLMFVESWFILPVMELDEGVLKQ